MFSTMDSNNNKKTKSTLMRLINSLIWFIILCSISFPIGIFSGFWVVLVKPWTIILPFTQPLADMLDKGVDFPYTCILNIKSGASLLGYKECAKANLAKITPRRKKFLQSDSTESPRRVVYTDLLKAGAIQAEKSPADDSPSKVPKLSRQYSDN